MNATIAATIDAHRPAPAASLTASPNAGKQCGCGCFHAGGCLSCGCTCPATNKGRTCPCCGTTDA